MSAEIYIGVLPNDVVKDYKPKYFSIDDEDILVSFSRTDNVGWQCWHEIKDNMDKQLDEYGDIVLLSYKSLLELYEKCNIRLKDALGIFIEEGEEYSYIFRLDH